MHVVTTTSIGDCCCTPDLPCDCPCCDGAGGYWTAYNLSISGIVNTNCEGIANDCLPMNGNHTLVRDTFFGPCYYHTPDVVIIDCVAPNENWLWDLFCIAGVWYIRPLDTAHGYTSIDFNCAEGGSFALTTSDPSFQCGGFPAVITLTPAGDFYACGEEDSDSEDSTSDSDSISEDSGSTSDSDSEDSTSDSELSTSESEEAEEL